jgi:hypothetical protein
MVSEKEKAEMVRAATNRNLHVLTVLGDAHKIVWDKVDGGWSKADINLLAGQMKDIAERFD